MSLRRRMVLLTAAAVALAVVLSAVACYLAVQRSMRARIDHQLQGQAAVIAALPGRGGRRIRPPRPTTARAPFQLPRPTLENGGDVAVLSSSGVAFSRPGDSTKFPVTAADLAVASGAAKAHFRNATIGGTAVRVYVAPAGKGRAVMAVRALTDLNSTLHDLAVILLAIALAGVALAGVLGMFVARAAVAPVHLLRRAAEHVASTGDLSRRIDVTRSDDLGRLGRSFNEMLRALEDSQRAQRQLVADASHELRTPVATIRTNLEVLMRNADLPAAERGPLLRDLIGESAELGALVEGLLESARESGDGEALEAIELDRVTRSELERWGRRHPEVTIVSRLDAAVALARESRLRRALGNLLDNAIKWSPPGEPIEVTLSEGALTVRDHGPGFEAADLAYVFDRFYRASAARAVPGSGLGLSIVRKVAEEHGGAAWAKNASGGGASVTVTFPLLDRDEAAPVPGAAAVQMHTGAGGAANGRTP